MRSANRKLYEDLMLRSNYELIMRALTGSIFAATILGMLYFLPPIYFSLLLLAMLLIILCIEWPRLAARNSALWLLIPLYPIAPFILLLMMNNNPAQHALLPLLFITAFCNDTGAYLFGKLFGNHSLSPAISPKKTWEGVIGGFICVIFCLLLFQYLSYLTIGTLNYIQIILFSLAISISATTGDLFESWLKRQAHIKDTGSLLPGHGGLLDRLDSVLFLATLFSLFQFLGLH